MFDKLSLNEFSEVLFSSEPVPGGGGACALTGALAASLAGMVTNLTIGKKKYAEYENELIEIREKAEILRKELLECIDDDAEAFKPLAEVYSLSKDSEGYEEKKEECLKIAASSPYRILEKCVEVIELAERLGAIGSKLSVSDAASALALAVGAMKTAYVNVIVNTDLMADKDYAGELEQRAKSLVIENENKAELAYKMIIERITNGRII